MGTSVTFVDCGEDVDSTTEYVFVIVFVKFSSVINVSGPHLLFSGEKEAPVFDSPAQYRFRLAGPKGRGYYI